MNILLGQENATCNKCVRIERKKLVMGCCTWWWFRWKGKMEQQRRWGEGVHKDNKHMRNMYTTMMIMMQMQQKRQRPYHIMKHESKQVRWPWQTNKDGTMQYNKRWTWCKKQKWQGTQHDHGINIYEWNMQNNYDNATNIINTRQQLK